MDKQKRLAALGASFWILGLVLFVLGLNIPGNAGQWMTVTGSIAFLTGLGLEGIWWFRGRREQEEKAKDPSGERS